MKTKRKISWAALAAWAAFALTAMAPAATAFQPAPYYAPEHYIDMEGARICYLDSGEGEVMLLVHGWAGNAWNWSDVFDRLTEDFRVVVVDLPGCGKSGCPKGFGFGLKDYADFLDRFMERLGIDKATLVGSSMGGAIVAWTAVLHPQRMERLILVDAAGTSAKNKLMKLAGSIVTARTVIPLIHAVFPVNEGTLAAVPDSEKRRVELAEQLYASDRRLCAGKALARSMRNMGKLTIDDRLKEISAPTLVIWGSNDGLLPIEAGEIYRDGIRGARLEIIEGGDHTSMQWKPEAFLAVVLKFMEE